MLLHICTRRPSKTGQWVRWAALTAAAAHVQGDTAPRYIMQAACFRLASRSQAGSIPLPAAPRPHTKHIPHQLLHSTWEPASFIHLFQISQLPSGRKEMAGRSHAHPSQLAARCSGEGREQAGMEGMLCTRCSAAPSPPSLPQ